MKLKKTWAFSDDTYINNKISKNLNTYRAADVNCITNQQESLSLQSKKYGGLGVLNLNQLGQEIKHL